MFFTRLLPPTYSTPIRILLISLISLLLLNHQPTYAIGFITVTTTDDKALDDPNIDDGQCSLREAIDNANRDEQRHPDCPAGNGVDTITFTPSGTITLVDGEMRLSNELIIEGPITISGDNQSQIFVFNPGVSLTLINLTLEDGFTGGSGGAILNSNGGDLNIIGSTFQNNTAEGDGGAIRTNGTTNILGSHFVGNEAIQDGSGTAHGGAIIMTGAKENQISGTLFNGNTAGTSGGAIWTSTGEKLTITDSIFNGNIALDDDIDALRGGGAIYYSSTGSGSEEVIEIKRSIFNGNLAPEAAGGAIINTIDTTINISESTFNGNIAGGIANGRGGAILNANTMTVHNSTFNGNIAALIGEGGAFYNDKAGLLTISNSSFFGNSAATGKGGVLYNTDSNNLTSDTTADFINVTISSSSAMEGGAIYNDEELVRLSNTIIEVALGAGGTCAGDLPEDVTSNLQHPGTACGATIPEADPLLREPTYNGGALNVLFTMELIAASPAIDGGDPAVCAAAPINNQDQRGEARPKDGDGDTTPICDIGAFENDAAVPGFGSTPVQPGPINFGTTTINTPIAKSISVFETGNFQLSLSGFILSGTNPQVFDITTITPINMADGANPQNIDMTCTPPTVGVKTAQLTFSTNDPNYPSVTFDLICEGTPEPEPAFDSEPAAPGPINLGSTFIGTAANSSFNVKEAGTDTLIISNGQLTGQHAADFTLPGVSFPITINDGDPASPIAVQCVPPAAGLRQATLTLDTNDPNLPSVDFSLVCEGIKPPDVPITYQTNSPTTQAPYSIVVSADGRHIYTTNVGTPSNVSFYRRNEDGGLDFVLSSTPAAMDTPWELALSPDGKNLYVTDQNANALHIYSRNTTSGFISYVETIEEGDCLGSPFCFVVDGLEGARGIVISPDGKQIYIASLIDDAVIRFRRNTETGSVIYGGRLKNGEDGVSGLDGVRGIGISPDGRHIYVTGYNDDTVVLLEREPLNGIISFGEVYDRTTIGRLPRYLDGAYRVEVSPDGKNVYVTGYQDHSLVMFERDSASGRLTSLGSLLDSALEGNPLQAPSGLAFSPDGQFVYVSTWGSHTLNIFSRPPAGGALTLLTTYRDGVGGVDQLQGAWGTAVNPDDHSVYVAARIDMALNVFPIAQPAPLLLSLNPASTTAGGSTFTLTTIGEDFGPSSVIYWDGAPQATTYINATTLETEIDGSQIATSGTVQVDVRTPAPGGGTTDSLPFVITEPATPGVPAENPVPSVQTLTPSGLLAGSPATVVSIAGSNFIATSQARWNGADRPTTYVSSTQLQIALTAADLLNPGPAAVTVFNPTPGGGLSNAAVFAVTAPGENPVPTITSLSPASVTVGGAGGTEFTLTINGYNFIDDSTVYWNDQPRFTTYIDGNTLQIQVVPTDLAAGAPASIKVINPEPGGGPSNTVTFRVASIGENLVPAIDQLSVTATQSGNNAFLLTITGSNFMAETTVQVNETAKTATFIDSNTIRVQLTTADIGSGTIAVQVTNPAPGGGKSNTALLTFEQLYIPFLQR